MLFNYCLPGELLVGEIINAGEKCSAVRTGAIVLPPLSNALHAECVLTRKDSLESFLDFM